MAYATDADLVERYPTAAAVSATLRGYALDDAEAEIDDDLFGDKTVRAHCLLAMHYLQRDGLIAGGEDGPVTSRRMGELAISYGAPGETGPHGSTRWGRLFDEIAARVPHPLVVG